MDGGVAADHGRPVDPGSRADLGARADQGRPVDSGAVGDVGLFVDPDVLALSLAGDVDLDPAFEAVEVGLHIRGVAAYVLPVTRRHPAEDRLALLEELWKDVARPVRDLAGPEEVEHRGVEHVNPGVGEVGYDL